MGVAPRREVLWVGPLVLALLLACVPNTSALKGTSSPRSTAFITAVVAFGFDDGGTVSMSSNVKDDNLSVHGCTSSQWTSFLRNENNKHWNYVCGAKYKSGCEVDGVHLDKHMLREYAVQRADQYHFIMINCGTPDPSSVTLSYELLNPGGEQLGVGHQPLPHLFIATFSVWMGLFMCRLMDCALSLVNERETATQTTALQVMLLGVVGLKTGMALVSWLAWMAVENTGYENVWLELAGSFLFAASEAALLTVLTMVATGWKVTTAHMPSQEFRSVLVALSLLLSTLLFFSLYNDGYYFLALMILYFFMLPKIFSTASRTANVLHTQALLLTRSLERNEGDADGMREAVETLLAKVQVLRAVRFLAGGYCVVVLGKAIAHMFMPYRLDYLNYVLNEVASLAVVSAALALLRPSYKRLFTILPSHYQQLLSTQIASHHHLLDRLRHYLANEEPDERNTVDLSKVTILRYPQAKEATHPSRMRMRVAVEEGHEHLFENVPDASE
eukprot:TRINITY_DN5747_c0_g1_i1.p1 TRINITY_DN5747_c0_g1~~TRINITY_DN5747_c0_g1_i1.p1  ORF type:complete len:502 (+),score=193.46 TRINITY_DN5747_c0_g1_i1:172-1677(+)